MADAWKILTANATDTTDAWAALNSQQTTSGIPGTAVNEIAFTITGVTTIDGSVGPSSVSGAVLLTELTASTEIPIITELLEPELLPVNEGC